MSDANFKTIESTELDTVTGGALSNIVRGALEGIGGPTGPAAPGPLINRPTSTGPYGGEPRVPGALGTELPQ